MQMFSLKLLQWTPLSRGERRPLPNPVRTLGRIECAWLIRWQLRGHVSVSETPGLGRPSPKVMGRRTGTAGLESGSPDL